MKLQPLAWFSSLRKIAADSAEGTAWKGQWLIGICLIFLVVFTWLPMSYFRMVGWPWIILWQLGFLCAGGSLVWMLRQFKLPFRGLGYGLDWLILFTSSGLLLSAALSSFPTLAAWNLVLVACYALVFYSIRNLLIAAPCKAYGLWAGLAISISITAVISLSYWRPDPSMWVSGDFGAAIRNAMPLGHHNFVGGYFALTLPLVFCFAMAQKNWLKLLFTIGSVTVLFALYVSGSRGAYLGFLVYALVAMAVALLRSRGSQRKRLMIACLAGLIIIVAGIGTNPRVRDLIGGIQISQETTATVQVGDGPARDRWFMLRTAANILRDRPLLGVGPGNMARVSNLYRPIETGTGLDHVQQLHNTPAQFVGELGLWGIAIYFGWIVMCGRLWLRVHQKDLTTRDRWMLYGIGGSVLAYGASSLTDYQLENIGIATVLTLNTALLIYLADQYLSDKPQPTPSKRLRRIYSLAIFAFLAVALRFWLPMDTALYLGHLGNQQERADNYVTADQRWTAAANLIPWDPTYDALAGGMLYQLEEFAEDDKSKESIQAGIIEHFQYVLKAAPNDVWFNQNLAIAYMNIGDLNNAEIYAGRTAQLLTRNRGYTYFLLGRIYLDQGNLEAAITAFALQALIDPSVITMPLWTESPFSEIHAQVISKTQALNTELLSSIGETTPGYSRIYENWLLINWWFNQELPSKLKTEQLRPVVHALLKTDSAPQEALDIVQSALTETPDDEALLLLQAWLRPEQYLDDFFSVEEVSPQEQQSAENHIRDYRNAKAWIQSLWEDKGKHNRQQLALAYRNQDAQKIGTLLYPDGLQANSIATLIDLFPDYIREFPELDHLLERAKISDLGLPHVTNSNFQSGKLNFSN
ncbi:MAG: O-antigen ligase family protein [Cyanobacteria bacterium P01_A01_bin.123]